jgi:DNA-binding transcriptional LysR family regulator
MEHHVSKTETVQDLLDLRAFCLVVDAGSITGAARILGETKGSVSRRITRLERALGVALLRRSPRLVQATEDGAAYRVRLGKVLELLDDTNAAVRHTRAAPSGHLRVTAPNDLGASLLAPLVCAFVARYPDVSVEMLLTQQVLDFDANQVDVALRATPQLPDSSLIAHRLQDLESGLFAAPAYLAANPAPVGPEELATHQLLLPRTTRGVATIPLGPRDRPAAQVRVHAAVSSSDFAFLRACALAAAGIAMLPLVLVGRDLAEGALVRVLPDHVVGGAPLFLLYPGTRFLPPKIRVFRDFLLESFGAPARHGGRA